VIAIFVEGDSDAGFVNGLCKEIGVECKVFVLRGNRAEKAIRKARALANSYTHILFLKDVHRGPESMLNEFEERVGEDLRDLMNRGVRVRVLRVRKSIESWILAGLCEGGPEEVEDPVKRLSERIGNTVIKAEKPYSDLAKRISVEHAMKKSQTFNEFIRELKSQ